MRCAVEKDLAEYQARIDREAAFDDACERAADEIFDDIIDGEMSTEDDHDLADAIVELISTDDVVQCLFADESKRAAASERLKNTLRPILERRANELAPARVEADRQAAEEKEAEEKAERMGLL